MAAPLLVRGGFFHIRHHHLRLAATLRPWCSFAEPRRPDNNDNRDSLSSLSTIFIVKEKEKENVSSAAPSERKNQQNEDYRKWRVKEDEILKDIESITLLTKEILHSDRYMDGERLTHDDEKAVLEKLLAYHPHSEDKIGCGFDSIMVDRHPQFKKSRCLFVVRIDGGWIDFSYQKCIREYIRHKYPTHAERFIKEHYKRGSG